MRFATLKIDMPDYFAAHGEPNEIMVKSQTTYNRLGREPHGGELEIFAMGALESATMCWAACLHMWSRSMPALVFAYR